MRSRRAVLTCVFFSLCAKNELGAEAGVQVNQSAVPDFQVSFGGVKQSGFGKDMGAYALEGYTQAKAVHVNLGINL